MTGSDNSAVPLPPESGNNANDLRARIAAALMESRHGLFIDDAVDAADAVIRELCMHRQEMSEWDVLNNGFRGHRYVTHWVENSPDYCIRCGIPHTGKCLRKENQ